MVSFFHCSHASCVPLWLARNVPPVKFWSGQLNSCHAYRPSSRMVTARLQWLMHSAGMRSPASSIGGNLGATCPTSKTTLLAMCSRSRSPNAPVGGGGAAHVDWPRYFPNSPRLLFITSFVGRAIVFCGQQYSAAADGELPLAEGGSILKWVGSQQRSP